MLLRVNLGEKVGRIQQELHRLYKLRDGSCDVEEAIKEKEDELSLAIREIMEKHQNRGNMRLVEGERKGGKDER